MAQKQSRITGDHLNTDYRIWFISFLCTLHASPVAVVNNGRCPLLTSREGMEVKKTWEGALEYCRETHTDLTTLQSDTEQLLTLSEIRHDHITGRVWIGLRFLGDHWLWVNGDPMVYENWRQGDQEHQCPLRKRCGALTKEGHWENWDCGEELHFICY
uniref:C-type lectin domain-containing protein n=1 Tax=Labrus bergylta TaxID=56723 RepID=A0A3Q3EWF0_9LABR